jgi:hypothetical protein
MNQWNSTFIMLTDYFKTVFQLQGLRFIWRLMRLEDDHACCVCKDYKEACRDVFQGIVLAFVWKDKDIIMRAETHLRSAR